MKYSPKDLLHAALSQEGLLLVTAGNLAAVILGAAIWLILATILTVGDYGFANYILSIGALIASMAGLGLPTTVQTYIPKGEEDILPSSIMLVLIASLFIGIPLTLIHPSLPLIILGSSLFTLAIKERLGRRKYRDYAIMQGTSRAAILSLVILLVPEWGVSGVLYSFALIYLALSLWIFRGIKDLKVSLRSIRKHVEFAVTALLIGFTGAMGVRLDKILIGFFFGNEALGYYQLAFQFYVAMTVIPVSLSNYLLPEKSSGRKTKMAEIVGIALSIAVAVSAFLLIPWTVRTLFPRFYPMSATPAQIASFAIIFDSIFSIWAAGKYSREDPVAILIVNIASVSFMVLSIIMLGSIMGIIGLAISLLIYRGVACTLGLVESRVKERKKKKREVNV